MKKKSMFRSKSQMIIYTLIFIICLILFIKIGTTDYSINKEPEAKKFSSLYNLVSDDNLFVFSKASEILHIVNSESGIILLGFPSNVWTNQYASILNDVAKEMGIDKIYYYDFLEDRKSSNGTYETLVKKLSAYVTYDDLGHADFNAPSVIIVKRGEVIAYFDELSTIRGVSDPKIYYNENTKARIAEMFRTAIKKYLDREN